MSLTSRSDPVFPLPKNDKLLSSSDPHQLKFCLTYIHIYSNILFCILSEIYSDSLSDINSDILFGILSDMSSDLLSGILWDISSEILCGRRPAGNTLILSLLFGSGGEHCDLALAVEVRRGTQRSEACSWGPAEEAEEAAEKEDASWHDI